MTTTPRVIREQRERWTKETAKRIREVRRSMKIESDMFSQQYWKQMAQLREQQIALEPKTHQSLDAEALAAQMSLYTDAEIIPFRRPRSRS